jgi:CRP-like cAMP-binding protein
MSTQQLFHVFKQITPEITDDELSQVMPLLTESKLKRGQHLVTPGQNLRQINFIVKGAGRMYYSDNDENETNILLVIENGFLHDYESLLLNTSTKFFIQATEYCEIMHIDYSGFEKLLNSTKNWEHCGRIINQFVLIGVFRRVQAFRFLSPEQLYLKLIEDEPHLVERFSQEYIAGYIGVKRESLSRIKKRFAKGKSIITKVT